MGAGAGSKTSEVRPSSWFRRIATWATGVGGEGWCLGYFQRGGHCLEMSAQTARLRGLLGSRRWWRKEERADIDERVGRGDLGDGMMKCLAWHEVLVLTLMGSAREGETANGCSHAGPDEKNEILSL